MVKIALMRSYKSCTADLQLEMDFFSEVSSWKVGAWNWATDGNLFV